MWELGALGSEFWEQPGKCPRAVSMQLVCSREQALCFISGSSLALPEIYALGFSFGRKVLNMNLGWKSKAFQNGPSSCEVCHVLINSANFLAGFRRVSLLTCKQEQAQYTALLDSERSTLYFCPLLEECKPLKKKDGGVGLFFWKVVVVQCCSSCYPFEMLCNVPSSYHLLLERKKKTCLECQKAQHTLLQILWSFFFGVIYCIYLHTLPPKCKISVS